MTIRITMTPAASRPGAFDAMFEGRKLCRSRQPFYDGARVPLGEGIDPTLVIKAWHEGASGPAMRGVLHHVAEWTVHESERTGLSRVRWKPFSRPSMSSEDAVSANDGVPENALEGLAA